MNTEILTQLFQYVIGPGLTLWGGSWFGRRQERLDNKKKAAETAGNEIQNTEGAIKIWREMAEALEAKLATRDNQMTELKMQLDQVFQQNTELLKDMTILKKDYAKLLVNYNELKKSIKE